MHRKLVRQPRIVVSLALLLVTGLVSGGEAIAQSSPCEPPRVGEYLLLVVNQNAQTPDQLRQTLPPNAAVTVCNYLGNEVTRISGFTNSEVANSWAQYLTELEGLQAFVARPAEGGIASPATPTATPVSATTTTPTATSASSSSSSSSASSSPEDASTPSSTTAAAPTGVTPAYNPQQLGAGYAVLVDYSNRPEVATDVQNLLSRQIGLVSYQQRPYLLAVHTDDVGVASSILQTLSDRNFTALIIDSRRAVLLSPSVATP
jgi:hypothetical protein